MQKTERKPLFDLGQLVATPGALAALEKSGQSPMDLLSRHVTMRASRSSKPNSHRCLVLAINAPARFPAIARLSLQSHRPIRFLQRGVSVDFFDPFFQRDRP